jgi:hypothetical protein
LERLLAQAGGEGLAALAVADARALPEALARCGLGRAVRDPEYVQGRAELLRMLNEAAGADLEALWPALRPHLAGPAALVLTQAAPDAAPGFRLRLALAVTDAQAGDAVRLAWPRPAPGDATLLSITDLQTFAAEQAGVQAANGGDQERNKSVVLKLSARPRALRRALAAWAAGRPEPPGWLPALTAESLSQVERLELETELSGAWCVEELRCWLAEGARGPFANLLNALQPDPKPWAGLQAALPGGQDVVVLVQAQLPALGLSLTTAYQLLERAVRGSKWSRTEGQSPQALAPDRFGFLTPLMTGVFGVAGHPTRSGEAQLLVVAATPGQPVEQVRQTLSQGLGRLGAAFETTREVAAIGPHAPLAARGRGRGFLPAPVIGLSEGWLWLCSSTAAYHELVAAFAPGGQTLAAELAAALSSPGPEVPWPAPAVSALCMRVNLPRVAPLTYASWVLGESRPELFGWKVPGALLPAPGFLRKHLGPYAADVAWEKASLRVRARGTVPGGALAPLALVALIAEEIGALERSRPEALRSQLEALQRASAPDKGSQP